MTFISLPEIFAIFIQKRKTQRFLRRELYHLYNMTSAEDHTVDLLRILTNIDWQSLPRTIIMPRITSLIYVQRLLEMTLGRGYDASKMIITLVSFMFIYRALSGKIKQLCVQ